MLLHQNLRVCCSLTASRVVHHAWCFHFNIALFCYADIYFLLGVQRHPILNNSVINILDVGRGINGLLCVTNNQACCATVPNRIGEFYYPNNAKVPIREENQGFWRGRGDQHIRLNRKVDASTPKGVYRCEIPDVRGVLQDIYITLQ